MRNLLSTLGRIYEQALTLAVDAGEIWLENVPGVQEVYCGVDSAGNLCVAFPHDRENYALELSGLVFTVGATLQVKQGLSEVQRELTCDVLVFVLDGGGFDRDSALSLASAILIEFESSKPKAVSDIIYDLSKLLRKRAEDVSELGLWGELFTIYVSSDIDLAIVGWGDNPSRVFDFQWGSHALEVKTSTSPNRSHNYSLSQLRLSEMTAAFVCSVITQEVEDGVTAVQLRDLILQERLPSLESQRLLLTRFGASGIGVTNRPYSVELALESASIFEFERIARVECGPEVVDLSWSIAPPTETEDIFDWNEGNRLRFIRPPHPL